MKKISILLMLVFLSTFAYSNSEGTYSLTVKVYNLRNSKGHVQFALYNKNGTVPDEHYKKYFRKKIGSIYNKSSTVTFTNLPAGKYAANILHDENKNGKIDKGFILPIEGIGFSNYKSIGLMNRPKFPKASFSLNSDKTVVVKVIYM